MRRFPGSGVAQRAHDWLIRRLRSRSDGGFILLESIIAIAVITVVMSAVGAEFVTTTASTTHQRNAQLAAQLADSAIEQIRALSPSDLVTGRDSYSVANEIAAAPASVRPWMATPGTPGTPAVMDAAVDTNAPRGNGSTATIPTTSTPQKPGAVSYQLTQYLGWCYIPTSGSTNCVPRASITTPTFFTYLRAVAAITWTEPRCPAYGCSFTTSTLVSAATDATFRVGTLTPLTVIDPGPQTVSLGDAVRLQLTTVTGYPPYTWTNMTGTFPGGLSISSDGLVSGTVTGATGSFTDTVRVVDGSTRTATLTIVYTVTPALAITPPDPQISTVNAVTTTQPFAATGGSGSYVWSDPSKSLPVGLTITAIGVVSGIPTTVGTSTVTLTVTDAVGHTATATFPWKVVAAPSVTAPAAQADTLGSTVNVALTNTCPNAPCTFVLLNGPPGLSVTAAGTITGTIGGLAQSYPSATVAITDQAGSTTNSAAFVWTVYAKPSVTAPTAQTDPIGSTVSVQLLTTCPDSPCSYALASGPTGLSVSNAGVITGIVAGPAQTYVTVTVTVTDADNVSATTAAFTWTIQSAIVLTTVAPQATTIGTVVSYTLGASGGAGAPFTYSNVGNSLPPGLTLSPAGVITGTPTTAGTYTVQVKITDKSGLRSGTGSFTWTIAYPPLAASNPGNQVATLNTPISPTVQLSASGGSGFYVWSDAPPSLPPGISISPSGLITGIPTAIGSSAVTLTVTDARIGYTKTVSFTWAVVARPTITAPAAQTNTVGNAVSLALTNTCPNAPCTYALVGGPTGLSATSTGTITGTVTATPQTYPNVSVTITDADGATATTGAFTWIIYASPTVTAPNNRNNTIGATVNVPLTTACPNSPCRYVLNSGPPGLSVTAAGVITGSVGSPAQTYPAVTVTVTDSDGATATSAAFTWTVFAKPTVTAPVNQTDTIGDSVNLTLTTACPNSPCSYAIANPPSGLSVTSAGVISGIVSGTPQTYANVIVTITDADNVTATTGAFTWTVFAKPTVSSPGNRTNTIGDSVNLNLTTSCANGPCSYVLNNGPTGLSVTSSGVVTGTAGGSAQTYPSVTISVTDVDGATAITAAFTWTVYARPTVTAPPNQTDTIGAAVSVTLTRSCANAPCNYQLNNGPSGLSVNSAGVITGTVGGSAQIYSTVSVTITDAASSTANSAGFTWTVLPTIVSTTVDHASTIGDVVNVTLTASGGDGGPYTYSNVGSSLPPGLTLSPTGVVTGTPTTAGIYTVQVKIFDKSGTRFGTGSFTWTVNRPPLAATNPGDQVATLNTPISPTVQLSASGGSGSYSWSDSPRSLPVGLSISTSGLITGTPTTLGSSAVSLTVTDTVTSSTRTVAFTWKVVAKPTVTAPATQTSSVGSPVNLALTTTCPNTPCSYAFNARAPGGLTITSTGVVTGTISGASGSYTGITVTVTDADAATAVTATFSWTVNPAPTIASPGNQTTQRGAGVNLDVSVGASGGTPAYTYSASGLPGWLTINATTGKITGTAPSTNSTTTNIRIIVTDSKSATATSAAFTWNVTNLASSFSNQTSYRSTALNKDLDAYTTGGTGPYTYTASGLPPWVSLNGSTGALTGTSPSVAANSSTKVSGISVTVTDSAGAVITTPAFNWYVTDMQLTFPSAIGTNQGQNVTGYSATMYVGGGAFTKTYSAANLPTGLTMNSAGTVSGSTTTRGTFNVVFTVVDSVGATLTDSSIWTVS